jgi:hypothetical protein
MAKERGWWTFAADVDLNEVDLEHIAKMIREGYTSGEVAAYEDGHGLVEERRRAFQEGAA